MQFGVVEQGESGRHARGDRVKGSRRGTCLSYLRTSAPSAEEILLQSDLSADKEIVEPRDRVGHEPSAGGVAVTRISDLHSEWMTDPAYQAEYNALDEEFALASALIPARASAGLTQEQLAERFCPRRGRWRGWRRRPGPGCGLVLLRRAVMGSPRK